MASENASNPLLSVRGLKKFYPVSSGLFSRAKDGVRAVDGVGFDLFPGETLGLVGESGSGKSTTGRNVLQLERPTAGRVLFEGKELTGLSERALNPLRQKMQIIFQDPYASLNPRMTVGRFVEEPLRVHGVLSGKRERREFVRGLFERVGLDPRFADRYPHEFSGGQRQRVGIARAIALKPRFVVADEPITALDVSIQAQIVNLLQDIQQEMGLAYLFIAHDLSMIRYLCNRVAVMYKGRLVELANTDELYENPVHPYTKVLLSAVPVPSPKEERTRRRLPFDPNCVVMEGEATLDEVAPAHFVAPFREV